MCWKTRGYSVEINKERRELYEVNNAELNQANYIYSVSLAGLALHFGLVRASSATCCVSVLCMPDIERMVL